MSASHRAACIIGYPVKHSRSPKLHGYWIARYGLDAEYRREEVTAEQFPEFIANLASHGYAGANVTMPHKDAAMELSQPDDRARVIGAANTLWLDGDVLRSTNTDTLGFVASLDSASPGWDKRIDSAVVLGAGGAARAVVYGLLQRGIGRVHVVNRTYEKAALLRDRFGAQIEPAAWNALPGLLEDAKLLVNSTALGMESQPALDVDVGLLASDAVVADNVYVPLETPLLAAANARGLSTSDGLDMLLHQAVSGFELWFGVRPEVTQELYDLLAADITAS